MVSYGQLSIILSACFALATAAFVPTGDTSVNITIVELTSPPRAGDSIYFVVEVSEGGVYYATMELMGGERENGTVVDIMGIAPPPSLSGVFVGFVYVIPQSLASGPYYSQSTPHGLREELTDSARLNATATDLNGISQNVTLEGPQFSLTSYQFECTVPPAFTPITSLDDPKYRSFVLQSPNAGSVETIPTGKGAVPANPAQYFLSWDYRDLRNQFGTGIDNLTFEFVQQSGSPTGSLYNATYTGVGSFPVPATALSFNYPYSTADLTTGEWRLRANYTNTFENGGMETVYISEPFYIAGTSSPCYGLKSSAFPSRGISGVSVATQAFLIVASVVLLA